MNTSSSRSPQGRVLRALWVLFSRDPAARWQRFLVKARLFRQWSAFRRGLTIGAPIFAVRTDITTTKLNPGGDIADVAATTIDAALVTAGVRIICKKASKVFLVITNTHTSTHVVKFKAGASQDSSDYTSTGIAVTTGKRIFRPAADRVQADGTIYVDLDTGHTGALQAYELV